MRKNLKAILKNFHNAVAPCEKCRGNRWRTTKTGYTCRYCGRQR